MSDYLDNMDNLITIYLVRHARQSSPLCNVNVDLSEEGILQSELLGERLREYNIDRVYSSTLIRAVMTADIIRYRLEAESHNLFYEINDERKGINRKGHCEKVRDIISGMDYSEYEYEDLIETDFGELTGQPDSEIKVKYADYYTARDLKKEDLRIPGGENGEEVYLRMNRAINHIIDEAIHDGSRRIAVVSHGGAIRCYVAGILGMPQSHRFMIAKNMENTAITELRYHIGTKVLSVERLNDYSHLEGHDELLRKHFKNVQKDI